MPNSSPATNTGNRRSKQPSAAQVLQEIRPAEQDRRFLIWWDPKRRELWLGCGGRPHAVMVSSRKRLMHVQSPTGAHSRLLPQTVRRFRNDQRKVDGARLVDRLRGVLGSYVHFRDARLYSLLLAWTIGTYCYPIFSHFGYLFFHSKLWRSGKTRLEEVLSHLGFQATQPLNGPTAPTIRDTAAEGGTVILDTLERWRGKSPEAFSAAMEFLDAGFRKGGTVAKMVPRGDGRWEKELIPVFAPYVLAAIDEDSLPETALDRSFVIEMHRKSPGVKTAKYSFFRCEKECTPLRENLYIWALQNAAELSRIYESPELEADVAGLRLHDRAADIWQPLLAIARALGADALYQDLASLAVETGRDGDTAEQAHALAIVRALRQKADGNGKVVGMTSELVAHLRSCSVFDGDSRPNAVHESSLHELLTQWGFGKKSVRLADGPRRAWELADAELAEWEQELSAD